MTTNLFILFLLFFSFFPSTKHIANLLFFYSAMCQLRLQRLLQPHVSHSICAHHYTISCSRSETTMHKLQNNAPYFYLDILPCNDRSLGRDCTLLIAMATRAKYTSLNYLTCSPPYFFSFCLIPIFCSLSPSSLSSLFFHNKSRAKYQPQLPHFRTMWLSACIKRCYYLWVVTILHCYFSRATFVCLAISHPSSHNTPSLDSFSQLTSSLAPVPWSHNRINHHA